MNQSGTRLSPNQPCGTCAYREGAAANREVSNRVRAMICELGGVPFHCHHATDGRELNWRGSQADFFASMASRRDLRLCAGWKSAVAKRKAQGFFGKFGCIRRAIAINALDSLEAFLHPSDPQEKQEAQEDLWKALRFLVKRNIARLNVPFPRRTSTRPTVAEMACPTLEAGNQPDSIANSMESSERS